MTDAADGQALQGATVALRDASAGRSSQPLYGAAANEDGLYLIGGVEPGSYIFSVSFVGYESYVETIEVSADAVVSRNVALEPSAEELDEVVVSGERESGVARVTAGHQRVRPEEIELVPAPDLSADLGSYLSTLPGIVTTGDRGGQLFVRGGEPSQNLTLLDGMILYQPFHVIGGYSAFPADIISRADVYASAYSAKYAGRLSSVIDVAARPGNNRRFAGTASVSPFTASAMLEGPIIPGTLSFIGSARQSLLHRTDQEIYGQHLPFKFQDAFGKINFSSRRSRISVSGVATNDRGDLVSEIGQEQNEEVRWTNEGIGARWLYLPRLLEIATDLELTRSRHEMQQGASGDTTRSTSVENTRIALHASFFGENTTSEGGWDVVFSKARNELGGLFQNLENSNHSLFSFGFFVEPEFLFHGLYLEPGVRLQWYNVRIDPYIEPRVRLRWEWREQAVTAAVGLYNQQVVGLSDRRDAANIFTAWAGIPKREEDLEERTGEEADLLRGRIGQAVHALMGFRSAPTDWLEYSVEAYYKRLTNLFVGEWSAIPRLTTRLQPGMGQSFGFEARAEVRRSEFYGYVTYGLSSTVYSSDAEAIHTWYGRDKLSYRPAHDRRHQINALVSYSWRGFDVSVRWSFGSGLPYTRPLAFDHFVLIDDIRAGEEMARWRRVIFDELYDARLPTYHRLDLSVERTFELGPAVLTLQGSVMNAYDRRNIFYFDVFTLERKDQLPIIPSFGIQMAFE